MSGCIVYRYGRLDTQRSLQFMLILGLPRAGLLPRVNSRARINTRIKQDQTFWSNLNGLNSSLEALSHVSSLESSSEAGSVPDAVRPQPRMLAFRLTLPPSERLLRPLRGGCIYDRARIPHVGCGVKAKSQENTVEKMIYSCPPRLGHGGWGVVRLIYQN